MSKEKIAVMLDGGLGRVICAIPALQELAKTCDLTVVSGGWLAAYKGSGLKVIPMGLPNQADLLAKHIIVKPEPYWELGYRDGTSNLVEAFFNALDINIPEGATNLPYNPDTRHIGVIARSPKPTLFFQPFGSGGGADPRSMTKQEIQDVINKFSNSHSIFLIGTDEDLGYSKEVLTHVKDIQEAAFIRYVQKADMFVGCDSSGLHIRAAAGKEHLAYLASTSGVKYYKTTSMHVREGFEGMRVNPRL